MKIVILDGYTENPGDLSWEGFEEFGQLTVYDRTPGDKIVERIGDADVVYTNKTPISKETLDACPNIKFIGVLATGYNVVDVDAAREKESVSISQLTVRMRLPSLLSLYYWVCHHIGEHSDCVKRGDWTNSEDFCFWNHPLIER